MDAIEVEYDKPWPVLLIEKNMFQKNYSIPLCQTGFPASGFPYTFMTNIDQYRNNFLYL